MGSNKAWKEEKIWSFAAPGAGIRQGSAQSAVSGGMRVAIEVGGVRLRAQAMLSIKALGWALGGAARASALGEGVDDGAGRGLYFASGFAVMHFYSERR